jgi:hypothetical protein
MLYPHLCSRIRKRLMTWARRTCYAMCTQKAPHNCADDLYKKYGTMYEEQLQKTVLPAIKGKKGEAMLQEFAKRWKNHKLLVRQMWKLFVYLVPPPATCCTPPPAAPCLHAPQPPSLCGFTSAYPYSLTNVARVPGPILHQACQRSPAQGCRCAPYPRSPSPILCLCRVSQSFDPVARACSLALRAPALFLSIWSHQLASPGSFPLQS